MNRRSEVIAANLGTACILLREGREDLTDNVYCRISFSPKQVFMLGLVVSTCLAEWRGSLIATVDALFECRQATVEIGRGAYRRS